MEKKKIEHFNVPILLVCFVLSFLLFYNLDSTYLTNWDEAWYADISRNMLETGNFITPQWNFEQFFDKPPLYIWFEVLSFKLFGVNELAARLPSVISGIGVAVVLYFLASFLFGNSVGLLSVIVFSSTIGFLYRARSGNLDALLTFFLLLTMLAFYKALKDTPVFWFFIMGVSTGLGFLTKGALAFVFPVIGIVYLLLKKQYVLARLEFLFALTIGIVISFSWIFLSFIVNGGEFLQDFFLNQTEKIGTGIFFWKHFSLDYLWYLKSGLKLWFIAFILIFFPVLYRWKGKGEVLLPIYFLLVVGFLSFSENKSNWFLVPFYPITSIIVAYGMYKIAERFIGKRVIQTILFISICLIAGFQNVAYKDEYIVPDIAGDEARVALAARENTYSNEAIYLTNYYFPTIVYYSRRKTYAVYSEHERNSAWWIKPKSYWTEIFKKPGIIIITSDEELQTLQKLFPKEQFDTLFRSGSKLLVKKI